MQPLPETRRIEPDPPTVSTPSVRRIKAQAPPSVATAEWQTSAPAPMAEAKPVVRTARKAAAESTPTEPPPTLQITGLAKHYGEACVFENVDLRIQPGEFVAIVGESGVGKSTLLNCMAGLDQWDAGNVWLDGEDIGAMDDTARALLRRAKIGFVFQAFHVLPHLSVAQNVALPLMLLKDRLERDAEEAALLANAWTGTGAMNAAMLGAVATPESRKRNPFQRVAHALRQALFDRASADWSKDPRVEDMLYAVGLEDLGGRLPQQLSGGQLQRVAIARALIHRPRLILADEPTGNLDPTTAAMVMDTLSEQAREYGTAIVLVTHSQAAAARASRICNLRADGIDSTSTPRQRSRKPRVAAKADIAVQT